MTEREKLIRLISDYLDTDIYVINVESKFKKIHIKFCLAQLTLVVYFRNDKIEEMFCSDIAAICDDIINVLQLSFEDLSVE
jgi:hypothetical protein